MIKGPRISVPHVFDRIACLFMGGILILCTSACSHTPAIDKQAFTPPPPVRVVEETTSSDVQKAFYLTRYPAKTSAQDLASIAPAAGDMIPLDIGAQGTEMHSLALKGQKNLAGGCSVKDRFDNDMLLSYRFSGGQSKIGLKLSVNGPSLSNPGRMEFKRVMVAFKYRLNGPPPRKERCLNSGPVQGLIGSAYHELFIREDDTIWQKMDELNLEELFE